MHKCSNVMVRYHFENIKASVIGRMEIGDIGTYYIL